GALGLPSRTLRWVTARHHKFHDHELSSLVRNAFHAVAIDERRKHFEPTLWSSKPLVPGQRVEQVWFAGAHGGVGGGVPAAGLSDIAFLWMKDRAQEAGLAFDEAFVKANFRPDHRAPVDEPHPWWRLLMGRWRPIGDQGFLPQAVHATARARHADPDLGYKPPNLVEYVNGSSRR
ncbi:MAG TPA: DUF2235 domain-containing protein, partial [Candidatus Thermoplasmatota archaeon]|nr:DUF2235 domain-containing protein [Candidatus Thermoplasmatota archaeon]